MDPPNHQVVINNSNATFMCASIRVFPQHEVSWIFTNSNGEEKVITQTQDSGNSSKYSINREPRATKFGALTIVDATFEDRGTYSCNTSNDIGYTVASANLTIQGETILHAPVNIACMLILGFLHTVHPFIEQLSSNTVVITGNPLILMCLATGYPIPSINWLKDGVPFNVSTDASLNGRIDIFEFITRMINESVNQVLVNFGFMGNETIQEFLNRCTDISLNDINQLGEIGIASFIRFFNATQEDNGSYRCIASNELKTQLRVVSQPIQITVTENGKHEWNLLFS